MLSPAFEVLEVNPSFFERAISLSSSFVICNLIMLGLPRMSFLQATQYALDLLGILRNDLREVSKLQEGFTDIFQEIEPLMKSKN